MRRPKGVAKSIGAQAASASEPACADDALAAYCPDLDQWPSSWRYEERDVAPGRAMVECFTPFLRHLLSLDLSGKTRRRHRDNMWLLGGELIRRLHEVPRLRRQPIAQVVIRALDGEGGPLIHGADEQQQRAFDATCRRFYRFLTECRGSSSRSS